MVKLTGIDLVPAPRQEGRKMSAQILWEDTLERPIRPDLLRVLLVGETLYFEVKKGAEWCPTTLSEQDNNLLIRRIFSASKSWEHLATVYREKMGPLLCSECTETKTEDSWYCCRKALPERKPIGRPLTSENS